MLKDALLHQGELHTTTIPTHENKEKTYTYGTIIGHSPHPPTCVWVGWVFI